MRAAIFAFWSILAATGANAASLWDHNGSTLTLEASGAGRKFFYHTPRAGLPVTTGTLLFAGTTDGERYSGKAFAFSTKCGAREYSVSGPVSANRRSVTMYGKAPRVDSDCKVVGYKDDVLVFNLHDQEIPPTSASAFSLQLGRTVNGFHVPPQYNGKTIDINWPSNEHTIFAIEDMIQVLGAKNDILIGEVGHINNAWAVIDGDGKDARRMILFDDEWINHFGQYRVILAHEVAHHVCKHTMSQFSDAPWDMELEADRTAGAILRKAHDKGQPLGGYSVEIDDIVKTARAVFSEAGSKTHPPGELRLKAYVDGWRDGSSCLNAAYIPLNPLPETSKLP
jgi:hypothetical protein